MATETLNIKVKEDGGSRRTANEFKSLTKEILKSGSALAGFKKQIKGLGNAGLTREINRAKSATTDLGRATRQASSGVTRLGAAATKTKGPLRGMASSLSQVRGLLFSLGVLAAARTFLTFSDQFQNMENRIRLVTDGTREFSSTQERLQGIAKDTRQSLSATVETYVRLRRATVEAGVSTDRLFGVLTTLNKMLAISGATSMEAEQSMRQLSQAFSKGKLDGDEFRTAGEAMPDILTALQKSLNVTQGELRDMAEAGKLTTEVLLTAFEGVKEKVDKDFGESIKTFGQAWQLLKDEVLKATGELNKSTGVIGLVIKAMALLANHIGLVVVALKALVLWAGVKMVIALGSMVLQIGFVADAAVIATLALAAMALANPFTAILLAAGVAIGLLVTFTNILQDALDVAIGIDATWKQKTIEDAIDAQIRKNKALIVELKERIQLEKQVGKDSSETRSRVEELQRRNELHLSQLQGIEDAKKLAIQKEKESAEILKLAKSYETLERSMFPARKATEDWFEATADILELVNANKISMEDAQLVLDAQHETYVDIVLTYSEFLTKQEAEIENLKKSKTEREQLNTEIRVTKELQKALGAELTPEIDISKAVKNAKIIEDLEGRGKGRKRKDTTAKDLKALMESINPVLAAQNKLVASTEVLGKALAKGLISGEAVVEVYRKLSEATKDVIDPTAALIRKTQEIIDTAGLSTEALEEHNRVLEIQKALFASTGEALTAFQMAAISDHIIQQKLAAERRQKNDELIAAIDAIETRQDMLNRVNLQRVAIASAGLAKDAEQIQLFENMLTLYPAIEDELRALRAGTLGMTDAQKAQHEITTTQTQKFKEFAQALREDRISLDAYIAGIEGVSKATAKLREEIEATTRLTSGIENLLSPEALNRQQIDLVTSAFTGLEDQLISFTTTGKVDFKDMVDSMLADVTRLIIRMAVAQAISEDLATGGAIGGGAIGGIAAVGGLVAAAALLPTILGKLNFAHGGSFQVGRDTQRFAHGGDFQVGGQGGPDTQLVQFLASPGENVRVTAPGQSRLDNERPAPQAADGEGVTILNVMDPSQFAAVMASPAGGRLVLNTIEQNPDLIRKFIK